MAIERLAARARRLVFPVTLAVPVALAGCGLPAPPSFAPASYARRDAGSEVDVWAAISAPSRRTPLAGRPPGNAPVPTPLRAADAVALALCNDRDLRATVLELGVPEGMLRQAELLPNPAVEFDLRRTSDRAQPLQADVRIEYALTRALLTPARGAVAAHDLQAARLDAAASVLEAAFSATVLHARWEAAEERLRLARVSLATFAAARDGADALTQAGNISAIPAAAARASHEEARVVVARRELDALVAREALAARLGIADPARLVAAGPAVEPEAPATTLDEEKVVAGNLRLRATGERLVALAKKTGLLRLEGQTPDVVVDGHGEQDGLFVELGGGARISVPLFDRKQGSIAATEARYDGLAERFQAQARRLRAESRVVAAEVRVTDACARQYPTTILPARRNVLAETILMMNAMHASVFDVLDARRRLAEAESAAVDAIERQKIAHARALLLGNGGDAPLPQAPMSPRTAFEVPGEMTH